MSTFDARYRARQGRIGTARRTGFREGVASIFRLSGRGRPAPPLVHRTYGSLNEDAQALQRDGERLFRGDGG